MPFEGSPNMTSVAVPEPGAKTVEPAPRIGWLRHRLAAGVASVRTYLAAWAGGLVFWILAVPWLSLIGPGAWIGWIVLGLVFSLWWPLFLGLARWARYRLGVPLILAAPIAWVSVEYLRAYFLTGFPWYYLAHSQYRYLFVIQIADVTGSLGVSLLIAMVNAWLVELATTPLFRPVGGRPRLTPGQSARLWAMTILMGTTLCYGAYRVSTARFRPGPRVGLLQSNLEQSHKFHRDPFKVRTEFQNLISRALGHGQKPDLIVWPETSYPFGFIMTAPRLERAALKKQVASITDAMTPDEWIDKQKAIVEDLRVMTAEFGVPMLVGSAVYDHQPDRLHRYNTAILFEPSAPDYVYYHKMHLVPFGEFIPLIDTLPWLAALTPYRDKIPDLSFGRDPRIFAIGPYRFAAAICFEDTIPHVIGRFFRGADQAQQPDLLINLSNDGWFQGSSELDMHLAIGVFRAIEHRVPLARAVNTGFSALVDGNGEIRSRLPKNVEDEVVVQVPLDDRTSWYSRWGDWLGLSCLAVTIGWIPMGLISGLRRVRQQD
jgi:apolipoprotein N-acyltransferase